MAIMVPPEEQGVCRWRCIHSMLVAFILSVLAMIVLVSIYSSRKPHYYAVIDGVSGQDPVTNLGKPALQQVEFDLILGVKSRSPFSSECFEPGINVTVTYLGVQIASGSTAGQACAEGWHPEQMVRMPVIARGPRTRLTVSVLDSLAAELRRGVAVLDVSLRIPPSSPGDDGKLVVCRGRRVGQAAEDSWAPCDVLKTA